MLLFLYGKNEGLAFQKAKTWKDKILKENKISTDILFVEKSFDDENFGTLATDISIFGDISAFFIKLKKEDVLSEREMLEFVNSQNLFAVLSNNKELLEILEKLSNKNLLIQTIEEEKKEFFPSHFVEALQKKDKKNSWKFFRELNEEKVAEEILGVCVFAYKSLLAAATFKGNTPSSGVKDFSLSNAKKNLRERKIKPTENMVDDVEKTYFNLLKTYAESRSNNMNLALALEKWILES
jgi:hypothetical protein